MKDECNFCGISSCNYKDSSCPNMRCFNCLQSDHHTKQHEACPVYQDFLYRSIDNLTSILAEPFIDNSQVTSPDSTTLNSTTLESKTDDSNSLTNSIAHQQQQAQLPSDLTTAAAVSNTDKL